MNGGADLGDFISRLTEDPDTMKTLMRVAGNIMNEKEPKSEPKSEERSDRSGISDRVKENGNVLALSSVDDDDLAGRGRRKKSDDAENLIRLLTALKPYVSETRCGKIDGIIKILKLISISEKTGLLRSLM